MKPWLHAQETSGGMHAPACRRWQQQERGSGRQLHSDLTLPEQLREFWYPVAFSSQLAGNAMVPLELFGQPWVLFRDARGLAACVADACAHRACPLSLVCAGRTEPISGLWIDMRNACVLMKGDNQFLSPQFRRDIFCLSEAVKQPFHSLNCACWVLEGQVKFPSLATSLHPNTSSWK